MQRKGFQLDKSTSTVSNTFTLVRETSLIKTSFKKGLCHGWLVNFFFDYLTIIGRSYAKYRDLSAASTSVIRRSGKLRQIINLQETSCGWVLCFLVSRPFRSRDEFFFLLYEVTRYIILERFTRSNDV